MLRKAIKIILKFQFSSHSPWACLPNFDKCELTGARKMVIETQIYSHCKNFLQLLESRETHGNRFVRRFSHRPSISAPFTPIEDD